MQRIAMIQAAGMTAAIVAACTKSVERTDRSGPDPTALAAPPRWCWDTVEFRALACSGGTAHRSGDTLDVRLANGRDLHFIDDPRSEAPGGYHYVGHLPQPRLHVVEMYGHEAMPKWIFVSERTGDTAGRERRARDVTGQLAVRNGDPARLEQLFRTRSP